jgi:hypothetical protein
MTQLTSSIKRNCKDIIKVCVLASLLPFAAGCKRDYEASFERDKVRVIELVEYYGFEWMLQYRIRNNDDHQRQVRVRVALDFNDAGYDAIEPGLVSEEIITLQKDESRRVVVPVKKFGAYKSLKWSDRNVPHRATIAIEATKVFY